MDRTEYPLRGKSLRERRRISKLTRSAALIADPEDARLAHQLYEYLLSLRTRFQERVPVLTFIDRFTPWVVTVCLGAVAMYSAVNSEWTWVAVFTICIGVSWFAWAITLSPSAG